MSIENAVALARVLECLDGEKVYPFGHPLHRPVFDPTQCVAVLDSVTTIEVQLEDE
jgi:hypothetical protein